MGFLPPEAIAEGRTVEIEILGEKRKGTVTLAPLWDDPPMRA